MKYIEVKKQVINILKSANIENVETESKKLIGFVVGKQNVLMQSEINISNYKKILKLAKRRAKHVPLQYILGTVEFLNTTLKVNKHVLIPRNETELLTDIIIKQTTSNIKDTKNLKILDICCGSGAIGISLAKELNAQVTLSDVSGKALKVAKQNAQLNKVSVTFVKSNMFKNLKDKFNIIVSNPPYITTNEISTLEDNVKKHEPHLALDGGNDGLKFYREIAENSKKFLHKNGKLYLEFGINQENDIAKILSKEFKNIEIIKDYNQINRFIVATKK